jgi:hypothetical protein
MTPFGLIGASAIFQRYINNVLREFLDDFVFAYIDDIIIFTNGFLQKHRNQMVRVIKKLRDAGLQLDINKCEFEQKKSNIWAILLIRRMASALIPKKSKQ